MLDVQEENILRAEEIWNEDARLLAALSFKQNHFLNPKVKRCGKG